MVASLQVTKKHQNQLKQWFLQNQRPLPWRKNRDPYRVWISETMLQQTTTTAVIPFFANFMSVFPTLKHLAKANESSVLEAWAGLGYYSRARNLHRAAKLLVENGGFPESYLELIHYPGIGPYTSRAVSSIAFGENVGVVDGNVIRVLSRFHGQKWQWWNSKVRDEIQSSVDQWVKNTESHITNQALMELGATVCTPQSPSCWHCPLQRDCKARELNLIEQLPLAKPKRPREIWTWKPHVVIKNGKILIVKWNQTPFLKGQWSLPGEAKKMKSAPSKFSYRHSITHHDIFVTVQNSLPMMKFDESKWVRPQDIKKFIPASLVHKALRLHFQSSIASDFVSLLPPTSHRAQGRRDLHE